MDNKLKTVDDTYITEKGMDDLWNVWYNELHNEQSGLTLKIDRIHESTRSEFQRIEVIENKDFGKLLVLYGSLMVCDNDNNAYNEMLIHVPLFVHPSPKNVLIIGGGDCGALTEVTRHDDVASVTMCEIDKMVVDISRKHFPYLTEGLKDTRAKVVYRDGKDFMINATEKYDIIALDLSDPVGPAADLFQKTFHKKVYDQLTDDGILVAQSESPYYNQDTVRAMYGNLRQIFPLVMMYTCFMPIYPSTFWSFAFCSKKYHPIKDFRADKYDRLKLKTRYYNAEIHHASFSLPQFVKDIIAV